MPAMQRSSLNRLPVLVIAGLLVVGIAVPMSGGELGFGGAAGASAPPSASAALGDGASPTPVQTPTPTAAATPAPTATPVPTPGTVQAAIVPVTQFRGTATTTNRKELAEVLAGSSDRYDALALVSDEADAILAALRVQRPSDPERLVLAKDAATLTRDLAKNRKRLAFLRAADVTPGVRALAWGDKALFGVDRVKNADDWTLRAELPAGTGDAAFDPAGTWTLFAGGDILLDRGVYQTVRINGKGVDFPFDGGTAEITSRCKDCSPMGWDLPRTRRTGNAGAVRDVISGADLAIANFENPAPNRFSYHTSGTAFTADPRLIDGLVNAGFDYVSIANNHIGDAGDNGILQTIANLRKRGLKYSGAGKDLKAAGAPAILEANGTKVAVLAFDAIARGYYAAPDDPGSSQLSIRRVQNGIKAARKAGARGGHRLPALGRRVPLEAVREPAGARPRHHRRRGGHDHRQPRALRGGDGGLQGQADLVRARQLRVRPDVVGVHDGGHHPRADLPWRRAAPGPHAAAHHPRQGAAELHGPGRQRPHRHGPGVRRLAGHAPVLRAVSWCHSRSTMS